MVLAQADETDLLLPLHDGVHEEQPWGTFLRRLRQRVRADAAELIVGTSGEAAERRFAAPVGGASADDRVWRRAMRPGRAYAIEDTPGFGQAVRVGSPSGAGAWLTVRRKERAFSAADAALLARLAPHLAIALRTRATLDQAQTVVQLSAAALRRAGVGWIGFAADGRVIALSPEASDMLGESWAVGRRHDEITAKGSGTGVRAVRLRETGAGWMLLVPHHATFVAAPDVVLIGLVLVPRAADDTARAGLLADLFGLPPSEARLAAALARGASLTEAAVQLGLTIETVRNYSKRLFAKLRARGQTDVVRTVGESLARLV